MVTAKKKKMSHNELYRLEKQVREHTTISWETDIDLVQNLPVDRQYRVR